MLAQHTLPFPNYAFRPTKMHRGTTCKVLRQCSFCFLILWGTEFNTQKHRALFHQSSPQGSPSFMWLDQCGLLATFCPGTLRGNPGYIYIISVQNSWVSGVFHVPFSQADPSLKKKKKNYSEELYRIRLKAHFCPVSCC